ncbi:uncharacterized protein BO95DRAFT_137191 [Aspergillus brunneoviolaceus CBS 621.78]|uniref:Uncharacterized protein n=1 Tax=Aspergillus brunneoviolaceus CBS 621.78 TaxID=1450534 RepID=A0ACD1G8L3_9EURO|nr:hypothetical protein BO95DRAFT_137191 [Aspergillus brunneoviolaceus CBS 621.78]RAH45612.1 hypothetical protein BO95DRAFT_137191 [Aspergillus brunneoviolaceus CBS 621.78]
MNRFWTLYGRKHRIQFRLQLSVVVESPLSVVEQPGRRGDSVGSGFLASWSIKGRSDSDDHLYRGREELKCSIPVPSLAARLPFICAYLSAHTGFDRPVVESFVQVQSDGGECATCGRFHLLILIIVRFSPSLCHEKRRLMPRLHYYFVLLRKYKGNQSKADGRQA